MGAASFHFWGNYSYAGEAYDRRLLDAFPGYALLRLRTIRRHHEDPNKAAGSVQEPVRSLGDVYWRMKAMLLGTEVAPSSDDRIVSGEDDNVRISAIMVPRSEVSELRTISEVRFVELVRQRTLASVTTDTDIGGIKRLIVTHWPSDEADPR